MTPIAEHKCNLLVESGYAIVKFYDTNGWDFDLDEYAISDIQYCPYCGKRLEE